MFRTLFLPILVLCGTSCAQSVAPLTVLGKWHSVASGDTVASVAKQYDVNPEELAELNQISDRGLIVGREQIFIPLGTGNPPGDGKPVKETPLPSARSRVDKVESPSIGAVSVAQRQETCEHADRTCYLWPAKGNVTRGFGSPNGQDGSADEHHDGIDIEASRGTAVIAAEGGEVLYSGDAIKGYGNLLLIRHSDGNIAVYAHSERNLVKEGAIVSRGERIAEVGDSGSATRTHLHFEVRVNEQPVDPMRYLPARK